MRPKFSIAVESGGFPHFLDLTEGGVQRRQARQFGLEQQARLHRFARARASLELVLVGTLRLGRVHKGSPPDLPREQPFTLQKRQPLSNLVSRNPELVREMPFWREPGSGARFNICPK